MREIDRCTGDIIQIAGQGALVAILVRVIDQIICKAGVHRGRDGNAGDLILVVSCHRGIDIVDGASVVGLSCLPDQNFRSVTVDSVVGAG